MISFGFNHYRSHPYAAAALHVPDWRMCLTSALPLIAPLPAAGAVLQYGHGLFGTQSEVHESYLQAEANLHGWVLIASDWLGLSEHVRPRGTAAGG